MSDIGYEIMGAAMEVHRALGPGLLESAYKLALQYELSQRGFDVQREVPVEIDYKGIQIPNAYRIDLLVDNSVILELKAVAEINPIFFMQLITYLKLSGKKIGYLINFNCRSLVKGVSYFRLVNGL